MEKITAAVIDNLRQTGPAPSVQMQDVPRKPFGAMTDEEEAELDDLDDDENKDVRMTENQWDKHVVHPAEFEASDDDDLARAHGATRQSSNKRSFTDFGKDDAAEAEGKRAKTAEPEQASDEAAVDDTNDPNDDTIDDLANGEKVDKEPESDKTTADKAAKPSVDEEGDVGMTDPEPVAVEDSTIIKTEDVEADVPEQADSSNEKKAEETVAEEPVPSAKDDVPAETTETAADEVVEQPKEKEVVETVETASEKPSDKPEEKEKEKEKSTEDPA